MIRMYEKQTAFTARQVLAVIIALILMSAFFPSQAAVAEDEPFIEIEDIEWDENASTCLAVKADCFSYMRIIFCISFIVFGMESGALTLQDSAPRISSGHARRNGSAVSNRNHSGWHSPEANHSGSSCCCPHRCRSG